MTDIKVSYYFDKIIFYIVILPVADACFEFELRQVISLSSIFFLKINFKKVIKIIFRFYNVWIYPLSHQSNQSALLSLVLFWFPESTISL